MSRLFPFFLLLMMAAPVSADSVYAEGDATGPLVGSFAGGLTGHFVSIVHDAEGATITIPGGTIELRLPLTDPIITGPLADFGDLQVHDNAYGWVHIQGDFQVRAGGVEEAPRGLFLDPLFLVSTDLEWQKDGEWLSISASDTLISNDGGFQDRGPEPGAWALLQGDGDAAVMDWFAFGGAPFKTSHIGDEVVIELVGTLGEDAPDLLIRLEDDGHFARTADRFVFRFATLAAGAVPADDMLLPRGGFTFHAREDGHNIVELRLPTGMSGEVRWQQDLEAPAVQRVDIHNVTPYAPLLAVPELISTWDEPVWGELRIGEQTKVATHAAQEVRFRLTGLAPDTTYTYTLQGRDLAGNTWSEQGTLATGPRAGPSAQINVTSMTMGPQGGELRFDAWFDDGARAPIGLVHVFIDKRASDENLFTTDDGFAVILPSGASEVRIEVNAPGGRVSEVVSLAGPVEESPMPWWLALVFVAFARRR